MEKLYKSTVLALHHYQRCRWMSRLHSPGKVRDEWRAQVHNGLQLSPWADSADFSQLHIGNTRCFHFYLDFLSKCKGSEGVGAE